MIDFVFFPLFNISREISDYLSSSFPESLAWRWTKALGTRICFVLSTVTWHSSSPTWQCRWTMLQQARSVLVPIHLNTRGFCLLLVTALELKWEQWKIVSPINGSTQITLRNGESWQLSSAKRNHKIITQCNSSKLPRKQNTRVRH